MGTRACPSPGPQPGAVWCCRSPAAGWQGWLPLPSITWPPLAVCTANRAHLCGTPGSAMQACSVLRRRARLAASRVCPPVSCDWVAPAAAGSMVQTAAFQRPGMHRSIPPRTQRNKTERDLEEKAGLLQGTVHLFLRVWKTCLASAERLCHVG